MCSQWVSDCPHAPAKTQHANCVWVLSWRDCLCRPEPDLLLQQFPSLEARSGVRHTGIDLTLIESTPTILRAAISKSRKSARQFATNRLGEYLTHPQSTRSGVTPRSRFRSAMSGWIASTPRLRLQPALQPCHRLDTAAASHARPRRSVSSAILPSRPATGSPPTASRRLVGACAS